MIEYTISKRCCRCGEYKLFDEFYKDKRNKFNLRCECKECSKEYSRSLSSRQAMKRYQQSDKGKETRKRYTQTDKFKTYNREYQKEYRNRDKTAT